VLDVTILILSAPVTSFLQGAL